jgi:anthranilate phosphoribosyltransferase
MTMSTTESLSLAQRPSGMSDAEVSAVLERLVGGQQTPEQGAAVLVAWHQRGETPAELAAVVRFLLSRAVTMPGLATSMDLCGTGGSGLTRFNVSTTVAFVLAAAGVPVAKHGNKGSGRANGSFDLLEALRVPYQLTPERLARLHRETGVCFLFARAMHPVVGAAAPARKLAAQQVSRTVFNLAGPLANPVRPLKQLIGTTDERTAHLLAETLRLLGAGRADGRAVVVRGHPGIDEVSITGPTHVWEVQDGRVHHAIIERIHQHGLEHAHLPGGDSIHNAALFERLLAGDERGPLLDLVCANAGTALDCWHGRHILADGAGFDQARQLILDGSAWAAFTRHRELATELAGA